MIQSGDYVYSIHYNKLAEVVGVVEGKNAVVLEFENGDMELVDDYNCVVIEYPKLFKALNEHFASSRKCLELYQKIVNREIQGLYVEDLPNVSDRAQ